MELAETVSPAVTWVILSSALSDRSPRLPMTEFLIPAVTELWRRATSTAAPTATLLPSPREMPRFTPPVTCTS